MLKPSARLVQTHELHSDLEPAALKAHLDPQVELLLQRFPFISKLSGGGVVVRVIKTPETSRPLWGRFLGDSFHMVRIPRGEDLSPWVPIMHGSIHPAEGGSRVEVELRPHPSARTLSTLYAFFGVLILVASGLGLSQSMGIASIGIGLGLLLLFFPGFRARYSFRMGCELALKTLSEAMAQSSEPVSSTMSSGSDQRA